MSHSHYKILRNKFLNNKAWKGGAIHIQSLHRLTLFKNNFYNNEATYGGAFYLQGLLYHECQYILENNNWFKNTATQAGGAIYWENVEPFIYQNVFKENAAWYGQNIAS